MKDDKDHTRAICLLEMLTERHEALIILKSILDAKLEHTRIAMSICTTAEYSAVVKEFELSLNSQSAVAKELEMVAFQLRVVKEALLAGA